MALLPTPNASHVYDLNPVHAWHASLARQMLRYRSIAGLVSVQGVATAYAYISKMPTLAAGFAGATIVSLPFLYAMRAICVRNIQSEQALHNLIHKLRDHGSAIVGCQDVQARGGLIGTFQQLCVDRIEDLFRTKLGCDRVTCCIRMLDVDATDGKKKYITAARSTRMNVNRGDKSEPLPPDQGIAKALLEKKCNGCYFIPDIDRAVRDGLWVRQQNDSLSDVKSWIVSPINGWIGGRKTMLGILFVGSHRRGVFSRVYPGLCFELQAVADFLGTLYPLFYLQESAGSRQPSPSRIVEDVEPSSGAKAISAS